MTGRLILSVLLLLGTSAAQFNNSAENLVRRLRIRVVFSDVAPCDPSTTVVLTGEMGIPLADGSLGGECTAEFFDVPPGRYRATIKGVNVSNADGGELDVNPATTEELEVRAQHTNRSGGSQWAKSAAFVSVSDLAVPSNAAREFEKAEHLIKKQDWAKAVERLRKGLNIYPNYAGGFNNLGAVYSHQGKVAEAKEALQKAIALDNHLAAAYVNLGRVSFLDKDYPQAESLLAKATSLAPTRNPDVLFLLAYAQLSDRHLEQALDTALEGHASKLGPHASLHLVAANAYEQQHQIENSISQLELYLKEEPNGSQAEKAKTAIAALRSQVAAQ